MNQPRTAPTWPQIQIRLTDTVGHVSFPGREPVEVRGQRLTDTREQALKAATDIVSRYGSPLQVRAIESGHEWQFLLHPDGTIIDSTARRRGWRRRRPTPPDPK